MNPAPIEEQNDLRKVWQTYLLGWIPIFCIYAVATNNDWDFSKGFQFWDALHGAAWGLGPAILLLASLWPITGWMDRHGFSPLRMVANHMALSVIFAVAWHFSIYWFLYFFYSPRHADRAADSWFIWQSMWGMMMYGAVAGAFHAYRAVQRAKIQAAATTQAHALLSRAELAALRSKLNPHFLFNTLHSILALVRKDQAQAEDALLKFSEMLRYVLETERGGRELVTLREELDFVRDYLGLERIRLGHRLTLDWQVDDAALGAVIPALTLQPIVENSIKHAFNPRSAPGVLTIRASLSADQSTVLIGISDDGPGAAANTVAQAAGLGIRTVQRRLTLEYGEAASMQVHTEVGHGFAVHFVIPMTVPDKK
jgi:hypothetical protein